MKEQKFINLAKSSYHSEDLKPDNEEAVEQSLLRVALSHNNEHPLIFNIRWLFIILPSHGEFLLSVLSENISLNYLKTIWT